MSRIEKFGDILLVVNELICPAPVLVISDPEVDGARFSIVQVLVEITMCLKLRILL